MWVWPGDELRHDGQEEQPDLGVEQIAEQPGAESRTWSATGMLIAVRQDRPGGPPAADSQEDQVGGAGELDSPEGLSRRGHDCGQPGGGAQAPEQGPAGCPARYPDPD